MKLSVSVGDELWGQAKRLHPDYGTSELVQAALMELVRRCSPSSRGLGLALAPPPDAAELRQAAVIRLRETIVTSYQEGYRDALQNVEQGNLTWVEVVSLMDERIPFGAWDWFWEQFPRASEDNPMYDPVYYEGLMVGLRDVRQSALEQSGYRTPAVAEASGALSEAPAGQTLVDGPSGSTDGTAADKEGFDRDSIGSEQPKARKGEHDD